MILHSIISLSDIFCNNEYPKNRTIAINGGLLELSENENGVYVNRLYSTDPFMYLDKRYIPSSDYKE